MSDTLIPDEPLPDLDSDLEDGEVDDDFDIENQNVHPIRQINRQPNVRENNQSLVEKAYRTVRKIQEYADLRRFIERNEAILKLKWKNTSTV